MLEIKDEIIEGSPRYNVTDNADGTKNIELANDVIQQGTPLNKVNLEKAIMTRIGRDYVVNGGAMANVRAGENISQGDMAEYKITVDDNANDFYNEYFADTSHYGGSMYGLPFEWYKEGLYLSTKTGYRNIIIVADFKKAIKNKSNLFTYDVKKEYTIVAPQTLSNYSIMVTGIKKVTDNVFAIFYQYSRSWSYVAYNYAEIIGIDEEYNITSMSTISFSFSASSSSELLSFGENGEYLVGIVGNVSNENGKTVLQHLHISPDGTHKTHEVYSESSVRSRSIRFVQYDKIEENVVEFKILYTQAQSQLNNVHIGYKYNIQTDLITKYTTATDTVSSVASTRGSCIIDGKRWGLLKAENSNPNNQIYFRYVTGAQNMSQYQIIETPLPFDVNTIAFELNGKSFILQFLSNNNVEKVMYVSANGTLVTSKLSEKLVGTSFSGYVRGFGNSHEIAMVSSFPSGNVRYFLLAEPMAYKNSELETTSNLQKVCGISANTTSKGDYATIYQIQGKEATDATELVYN